MWALRRRYASTESIHRLALSAAPSKAVGWPILILACHVVVSTLMAVSVIFSVEWNELLLVVVSVSLSVSSPKQTVMSDQISRLRIAMNLIPQGNKRTCDVVRKWVGVGLDAAVVFNGLLIRSLMSAYDCWFVLAIGIRYRASLSVLVGQKSIYSRAWEVLSNKIKYYVAKRATARDEVWSEIEVQPHNHEMVMWDSRCQSLLFGLQDKRQLRSKRYN